MEISDIAARITRLRENKGVSARDMSLSIGQNEGYINNIENGRAMPSMSNFLYICEYLGVTPCEFFDTECADPTKADELARLAKRLEPEQLEHLIALVKSMIG